MKRASSDSKRMLCRNLLCFLVRDNTDFANEFRREGIFVVSQKKGQSHKHIRSTFGYDPLR